MPTPEALVRIWSDEHNAYWRVDGRGYTCRAPAAWVLPESEARARTAHCGPEKQINIEPATDLDRFATQRGAEAWQPIETAPKNGTAVLIGWFELPGQRHMETAWWHDARGAWCGAYQLFTSDPHWQPTHWMPLPTVPGETYGAAPQQTGDALGLCDGGIDVEVISDDTPCPKCGAELAEDCTPPQTSGSDALGDFAKDLAAKQEPLGREFAEALTPDLYVRSETGGGDAGQAVSVSTVLENDALPLEYKLKEGRAGRQVNASDFVNVQTDSENAPLLTLMPCVRDSKRLIYPESCDECERVNKCLARMPGGSGDAVA